MKSDIIHVNTESLGINDALAQAEAVAVYKGLSGKNALHLRLLTEEMMGMFRGLTNECEADFWIEDSDGQYQLHLITDTNMSTLLRKKLLATSTRGKNVSAKGIMGKVRDIFDRALEPYEEGMTSFLDAGLQYSGDPMNDSYSTRSVWSLSQYRETVEAEGPSEDWDELEKSIIANVADEIEVGIRGSKVELIVYKKF